MKCYCIIHFEQRNYVTSTVKLHLPSARILYTNLDYASDVISMFKMNYTTAFHGIRVNYTPVGCHGIGKLCLVDWFIENFLEK